MAEIVQQGIDARAGAAVAWADIAARTVAWAGERALALRDVVVLVPLAQHLPLARRAFARLGGWLPRVETSRTAAAGLPASCAEGEGLSLQVAQDRLRAAALLRQQAWARGWSRSDPRGFEQTVARFVETAHKLARCSAACPPALRGAWETQARALLSVQDGPGATERLLARTALEWVAASGPWPTDGLYALRPAGWVIVGAGGTDPVARAVASASDAPALELRTDPDADPLAWLPAGRDLRWARCESFEDEASRAAAQVLDRLSEGRRPVALIAQDRVLVRRVAALLARQQVPVLDETGWKLSTSRAAAGLMTLLRAASPMASTDDWLDWLKSLPGQRPAPSDTAVAALEQAVRRHGWTRAADLPVQPAMTDVPREVAVWTQALLAPLQAERAPLAEWMQRLAGVLEASGQAEGLRDDAAGRQVLATLRLDTGEAAAAWAAVTPSAMRLDDFQAAVDELLENAVFEPPPPDDEAAVVITPLRRAVLRPFAAAVLPGADDKRLGAPAQADPLLGEAVSVALGLPSMEQRQTEEGVALAHLLCLPAVDLLYRHADEGDVLGPSPWLERLQRRREREGDVLPQAPDPRRVRTVPASPVARPAPSAADRLPGTLSASTVEALRDCPYRFYARAVLGLREADELDDEAQKRDYGNWLHDVLWRFHQERPAPRPRDEDLALLQAAAADGRERAGLDPASFLPFEASFERFAAFYVDWLHQRDAQGASWLEGEVRREVAPSELDGITLNGRIDRIDRHADGTRELVDYKTGSAASLKAKLRDPLEDTQLAFYAALEMRREDAPAAPLKAIYLALDESRKLEELPHRDVEQSAQALVEGLSGELRRMRAGAPLPALGEGSVCERCEARGLCRRDHWADPLPETA